MSMKNKLIALVPMRQHSVRVPQKNYRSFAGEPLFYYILKSLQAVPELNGIMVDTDSPEIKKGITQHFPDVQIINRPENLRSDLTPTNEILIHDTSVVDADYYLQTHATNPLLKPETISKAITTFFDQTPEYDSLFGVTRLNTRLWDQLGRPINHNPNVLLRTQDLPPVYEENSCVYIFSRATLISRRNRLGERPLLYEIPSIEAWDIDEEIDFIVAEALFRHLNR